MSHVPTVLKSDRSVFDKMLPADDNGLNPNKITNSCLNKALGYLSMKAIELQLQNQIYRELPSVIFCIETLKSLAVDRWSFDS